MTGGRCSEVDLEPQFYGRDSKQLLLAHGRYSEEVVSNVLLVLCLHFRFSGTIDIIMLFFEFNNSPNLPRIISTDFPSKISLKYVFLHPNGLF